MFSVTFDNTICLAGTANDFGELAKSVFDHLIGGDAEMTFPLEQRRVNSFTKSKVKRVWKDCARDRRAARRADLAKSRVTRELKDWPPAMIRFVPQSGPIQVTQDAGRELLLTGDTELLLNWGSTLDNLAKSGNPGEYRSADQLPGAFAPGTSLYWGLPVLYQVRFFSFGAHSNKILLSSAASFVAAESFYSEPVIILPYDCSSHDVPPVGDDKLLTTLRSWCESYDDGNYPVDLAFVVRDRTLREQTLSDEAVLSVFLLREFSIPNQNVDLSWISAHCGMLAPQDSTMWHTRNPSDDHIRRLFCSYFESPARLYVSYDIIEPPSGSEIGPQCCDDYKLVGISERRIGVYRNAPTW